MKVEPKLTTFEEVDKKGIMDCISKVSSFRRNSISKGTYNPKIAPLPGNRRYDGSRKVPNNLIITSSPKINLRKIMNSMEVGM